MYNFGLGLLTCASKLLAHKSIANGNGQCVCGVANRFTSEGNTATSKLSDSVTKT